VPALDYFGNVVWGGTFERMDSGVCGGGDWAVVCDSSAHLLGVGVHTCPWCQRNMQSHKHSVANISYPAFFADVARRGML